MICSPDGSGNCVAFRYIEPGTSDLEFDEAVGIGGSGEIEATGTHSGNLIIKKDITLGDGGYLIWGKNKKVVFQGGKIILMGGALVRAGAQIKSGPAHDKRACICVKDQDGDGYWAGVKGIIVKTPGTPGDCDPGIVSCPEGYTLLTSSFKGGGDCMDTNSDVHPGQTTYFSTDRGDGSYDYNCDGVESKYWNQIASGSCGWELKNHPYNCCYEEFDTFKAGWKDSVPACGVKATYYTDCTPPTLSSFTDCDQCMGGAAEGKKIKIWTYYLRKLFGYPVEAAWCDDCNPGRPFANLGTYTEIEKTQKCR